MSNQPMSRPTLLRPRIRASGRLLDDLLDEIVRALVRANMPPVLFSHGGELVRIVEETEGEGAHIAAHTRASLRERISRVATFFKVYKDLSESPTMPPPDVVDVLMVADAPPFPTIRRVVDVPVFSADGTLETTPGYQEASGTWYAPSAQMLGLEKTRMTMAEAVALIMDEVLRDFPFKSQADRAAAFGLMILPFVRDMISGPTPLHPIDAAVVGTGKSLLATVCLIPALGRLSFATPPGLREGADDEWRKRITAGLRAAPGALVFDNVSGKLDSPSLAKALTDDIWADRILGRSEEVRIGVRCVWVATMNQATLSTELARRSVLIRLDAGVERPWTRKASQFRHPGRDALEGWCLAHRPSLVAACHTIVRAWVDAGQPAGGGDAAIGSYEAYARVIGGICHLAGVEGWGDNLERVYDDADDESQVIGDWFEAMWQAFKVPLRDVMAPMTAAELGEATMRSEHVRRALPAGVDPADASAFGAHLRAKRDRVLRGLKLVRSERRSKAGYTWWLERNGNEDE